jgi:diguanylate cyclase (GGDEF)-like protein
MIDGDLTAVVSFIGVVVQLGGELLLVLLFVLLRGYVLRRGYFAAWTAAWACGAVAIGALCIRYILMPTLGATPLDETAISTQSLYLAYQVGKLSSFALFLSGTAMYVTGSRFMRPMPVVFGIAVAYAVVSMLASTTGSVNELVVWQAPVAVMSLGACGALLFSLPASRRSLGSVAGASAFTALAVLWLLYGVAFGTVIDGRASEAWARGLLSYNTYFDLLLNIALGFAMVVVLMEDAKREVDDAQGELRVAHDQLRRAALYDTLTDSLNREAFAQGVGLEMARGTFGTVVIADLDNLKQVNDTFGHASGDKLLRQCADLLRSTLRPYDKLYRWGGDEFLLVLPSARGVDVTARLGDVLAGAAPVNVGPDSTQLAVSLGASDYTSAESLDEAIKSADEAMYRDKFRRKTPQHGMQRVSLSTPARAES